MEEQNNSTRLLYLLSFVKLTNKKILRNIMYENNDMLLNFVVHKKALFLS